VFIVYVVIIQKNILFSTIFSTAQFWKSVVKQYGIAPYYSKCERSNCV